MVITITASGVMGEVASWQKRESRSESMTIYTIFHNKLGDYI